jgi:hypothetical protein
VRGLVAAPLAWGLLAAAEIRVDAVTWRSWPQGFVGVGTRYGGGCSGHGVCGIGELRCVDRGDPAFMAAVS